MFDKDKLRSDLAANRTFESAKPAKGYAFPFARTSSFDQGEYLLRVCPTNDEKNPDGFVVVSRAGIERDSMAPKESTKYVAVDPSKSNYLLGILYQVEKLKILDQLKPGVKDAVMKLFPSTKYLFPVLVKAEKYETVKANGYKETRYKPSDSGTLNAMILEVYAESSLLTQLFDISEHFENFNDSKRGMWLRFNKKPNKNELLAGKQAPLNDEEKAMYVNEKYPSLIKMGKRDETSHDDIVSMISNAPWRADLEALGVDFTDYGPVDEATGKRGSIHVPDQNTPTEVEEPFDPDLNLDLD